MYISIITIQIQTEETLLAEKWQSIIEDAVRKALPEASDVQAFEVAEIKHVLDPNFKFKE